jgi:hypothetical protein
MKRAVHYHDFDSRGEMKPVAMVEHRDGRNPPPGTKYGTLCVLQDGTVFREFVWTSGGWSTPGTGWATRASLMFALGWRFLRVSEDQDGGAAQKACILGDAT